MFVLLTTPLQKILKKHGVYYYKYADDIQLYVIFDPAIPEDRESCSPHGGMCQGYQGVDGSVVAEVE